MKPLTFGLLLALIISNLMVSAVFVSFAIVVSGFSIVTFLFFHSTVGWFLVTSAHIIFCMKGREE